MSDHRELLERGLQEFRVPEMPYEAILRRRARRLRNQRIATGVVGLGIGLAAILIGVSVLGTSAERPAKPTPVVRSPLPPLLVDGEVVLAGQSRLDAVNRATRETRTLVRCTDPCVHIYRHSLSADGRWLAYEVWTCLGALPCEPEAGVWVTNALGGPRQLTYQCDRPDSCQEGIWEWSPEGATLIVSEYGALIAIDPSDGSRTPLQPAADGAETSAVAMSPDSTRVAFARGFGIFVTDASGAGGTKRLTTVEGGATKIVWSPDGARIAFEVTEGDRDRVYVMTADGTERRLLVDQGSPQGPGAPAWSPDGTRIAYVSTPGSSGHFSFETWVIGSDGSNPIRVYASECCIGDWYGPIWSPDGSMVAFRTDLEDFSWLAANADGAGSARRIDELVVEGWRQRG